MDLSPSARRFLSVTVIALSIFLCVAFASYSTYDWPFDRSSPFTRVANLSGPLGSVLAWTSFQLVGRAFAWLIPAVLVLFAVGLFKEGAARLQRAALRVLIVVVLVNTLVALTIFDSGSEIWRGRIGDTAAAGLSVLLGRIGSTIVVIAALLMATLGVLGRMGGTLRAAYERVPSGGDGLRSASGALGAGAARLFHGIAGRLRRSDRDADPDVEYEDEDLHGPEISGLAPNEPEGDEPFVALTEREAPVKRVRMTTPEGKRSRTEEKSKKKPAGKRAPIDQASLPPLSMLERGDVQVNTYSKDTLKNWSTVLEEKLANYGVEGRVSSVHHGPVVTTFEFEPAPGVRIKEITSRADDLALAMKARSLRMIAPIPGRAAVGIEIPNPESRIVYLHDILREISEKERLTGIMIALGVDVVGQPFLMNLCDAPHLLIAGTTGSGKSVCINTILASVLFQYRPTDVRLLLVDPKIVEMSLYNGIPHLMHPVITDPKEAAKVLEYLTIEMTRRNELFRQHGVRNIESYNSKIALAKTEDGEKAARLPYIVLIVDELGDLALAKGVDIESLLARLAQMARAAGIHMVLATQRPSVDVIVGKTKANFPTRIAFRVATKVDSRTILDTIGADKLLGKGDMLYMDALNPTPLRLHGGWVSEKDLEGLLEHWKSYDFDEDSLDLTAGQAGSAEIDDLDPLFGEAKGVVVRFKQGSTSLLQRKLHVGYARAARILDQLEQTGIVGPPDGSKPRDVYIESVDEVPGASPDAKK